MPNIKKFGVKQVTAGHRPTLGHKHVKSARAHPTLGHKAVRPYAGITAGPPGVNPQVPFAGVPHSKVSRAAVVPLAGVPPGSARVDKRVPLGKFAFNTYGLQAYYRDRKPGVVYPAAMSRPVQRFVQQNTMSGIPLQPL